MARVAEVAHVWTKNDFLDPYIRFFVAINAFLEILGKKGAFWAENQFYGTWDALSTEFANLQLRAKTALLLRK